MADLTFNSISLISTETLKGYFRVVVEGDDMLLFLVADLPKKKADSTDLVDAHRVPASEKTAKAQRAAKPGKRLIWVSKAELEQAAVEHLLRNVELTPDKQQPARGATLAGRHAAYFDRAKLAARPLWDKLKIEKTFMRRGGLSALVRDICAEHKVGRATVYQWFYLLCQNGFHADSLRPRLHNCGGKGVRRPWGEGSRRNPDSLFSRKKPGRKSDKGRHKSPEIPKTEPAGWSVHEERAFIAELRKTISPKMKFSKAYTPALLAVFSKSFTLRGGVATPELPALGTYPLRRAARRLYNEHEDRIERLKRSTTAGNFLLNHRGLVGRSYKGASGPGFRYMCDATRGNVYLRSSVNLAWFIGRPIVYLIVDVWSTTVVGFHVCLEGPSWATAQLALFSAFSQPEMMNEVWGITYMTGLDPSPTVPYELYVDRGELFCVGAQEAAERIGWKHCILASARADLKGLGEVLHRIVEKDAFFPFTPGAVDARRIEYELRTFEPASAVLTLRQYAALLALEIENYNLCADRRHRVTQEMTSAGVVPTPAGLWRFGHMVGIGYRKTVAQHKLITEFLPPVDLRITRQGAMLGSLLYQHPALLERGWASQARNFGAFTIESHIHTASLRSLWVPDHAEGELYQFSLSMEAVAKPYTSVEEHIDWSTVKNFGNEDLERLRLEREAKTYVARQAILTPAIEAAKQADEAKAGEQPSVIEARQIEKALSPTHNSAGHLTSATTTSDQSVVVTEESNDDRYLTMVRAGMNAQFKAAEAA